MLAGLDIVVIAALGVASEMLYHLAVFEVTGDIGLSAGIGLSCGLLFVLAMQSQHLYAPSRIFEGRSQIRAAFVTWLTVTASVIVIAFMTRMSPNLSRGVATTFFVSGAVALPLLRAIAQRTLTGLIADNRLAGRRRIVLIGDRQHLARATVGAHLGRHGYNVVEQFEVDAGPSGNVGDRVPAVVEQMKRFSREHRVDEILLAFDIGQQVLVQAVAGGLRAVPVPVHLLLDRTVSSLLSKRITDIGPGKTVELQCGPLTPSQQVTKRSLDVVLSLVGLLVLAPFFALIALAIKLDSPGPTLFRQRRAGFSGRVFRIFKFRSMTTLDDGNTVKQATRNDDRVTRVGRYLRKTSLDELPQLLNVLRGEMSLVGPRPHALSHDSEYDKLIATYALRHHMKPGITGWAQVNGYRGETSTLAMMEERVKLDLWYIEHWSLKLDLLAILLTVVQVFRPKNVY